MDNVNNLPLLYVEGVKFPTQPVLGKSKGKRQTWVTFAHTFVSDELGKHENESFSVVHLGSTKTCFSPRAVELPTIVTVKQNPTCLARALFPFLTRIVFITIERPGNELLLLGLFLLKDGTWNTKHWIEHHNSLAPTLAASS